MDSKTQTASSNRHVPSLQLSTHALTTWHLGSTLVKPNCNSTCSLRPEASSMLSSMRRGIGRGLAILGAGAVTSTLLLAYARMQATRAERTLPKEFVLELDLAQLKIVDTLPTNIVQILQGAAIHQVELRKVVKALELAGKDDKVKCLLCKLGGRGNLGGMATIQELHSAVQDFKLSAGQRGDILSVVHAPAFGEAGTNGTLQYYLASAFHKVYMQPTGNVGLLGLQSQQLFFRGLLDKLKILPVVFTREQYKTAAHAFTQYDFTAAHRENTESLLKSLAGQAWASISASRGMTAEQLAETVNAAPLLAREATLPNHKLLDGLLYLDQVTSQFLKSSALLAEETAKAAAGQPGGGGGGGGAAGDLVDKRLPRIPITKYLAVKELAEAARAQGAASWLTSWPWAGLLPEKWRTSPTGDPADMPGSTRPSTSQQLHSETAESAGWVPKSVGKGKPKVAVIHAVGTIVQGPVTGPPAGPPGQQLIDATKLSNQLERLSRARDVAAVVVRINSPGGSALGSDTLHRALMQLKASGKKLVVSCGDVAASGGMFMAVTGDHVMAQPGTLTGSIGVVVGKVDTSGLLNDIGVKPASIEEGSPNLKLTSIFEQPDDKQVAKINTLMDDIYDDFIDKVAAGRKMSKEAVRDVAGGRVYTGQQALQAGLVDDLGGLKDAVKAAKRLAGLPVDKEEEVVVFEYPPKRVPLIVRLLQSMSPAAGGGDPNNPSTVTNSGILANLVHAYVTGLTKPMQDTYITTHGSGIAMNANAQMAQVLTAAQKAVNAALTLEGSVSCYSMEAQMLSDLLV